MNIEYVCHACLVIETEDLRIATDPWFSGSANCNQWFIFPKPVNVNKLNNLDAIFISHGHEDHLHENSLRLLPKTAKVFYPYSFFGGAKEYIENLGFAEVKEAIAFRKYQVSEQTAVTFMLNSHDSIIVIESGGKVLVNINDALHSSPQKVIDFYITEIKKRWQKIDYVFSGCSGSSYFPNTMHLNGKNDFEIGQTREQLFVHNFCYIVKSLKPKIAVPFAADFVLLDDDQRWINDLRYSSAEIAEYYQKYFAETDGEPKIIPMLSGDRLENLELKPLSPYRSKLQNGELNHLIEHQYATEIKQKQQRKFLAETEAESLIEEIRINVEKRKTLYQFNQLKDLKFCLRINDIAENNFFYIAFANKKTKVWRSNAIEKDCLLTMKVNSEVLRYSIGSDWGADAISVGYGAEIHISDQKIADVELERVCMNLLACYPTFSDLTKTPFRTLQFLLLNPPRFTTSIRKLKKYNHESENYDRRTWLLNSATEIRKRYKLPNFESVVFPRNNDSSFRDFVQT
ncbi:MAG TPA: MBL fold metallo-hydrolase [Pyrinomonadaceae bacterium]|nr:MBL fold metallo-hydrolase [Pyrinomonadaceae bacterium]